MNKSRSWIFQRFGSTLAVAAAWGVSSAAIAQETDFEIGFRPMILGSRGEPANDEIHLMSSIGLRRSMGENWALVGTFHLEHHFTDYKITDTVSGATGKIGAHSPIGASVTLSYRF